MIKKKISLTFLLAIFTTAGLAAQGWGRGWGGGPGYCWGGGWGWNGAYGYGGEWYHTLFAILWRVAPLAIIGVIAFFIVKAVKKSGGTDGGKAAQIIRERYAKGEIDEAAMKEMLSQLK